MKHLLFSAQLPGGREVCVAPVSSDTYEANQAYSLGDDSGYFIYEFDACSTSGIEFLAKAASYDAAMRIVDIFLEAKSSGLVVAHSSSSICAPPRSPLAPHPVAT